MVSFISAFSLLFQLLVQTCLLKIALLLKSCVWLGLGRTNTWLEKGCGLIIVQLGSIKSLCDSCGCLNTTIKLFNNAIVRQTECYVGWKKYVVWEHVIKIFSITAIVTTHPHYVECNLAITLTKYICICSLVL